MINKRIQKSSMPEALDKLQETFENSECIWMFVTTNYRIQLFNKKAAANSRALHNKELASGDSILDFARDTNNRVDAKFITCFGKAATGQTVKQKQRIDYESSSIYTITTYTPVFNGNDLLGVSIVIEVTNVS